MSKTDQIFTCSQIETINSDSIYIQLENEPITKSLWLIFDESNNVILYKHYLYNGYEYSDSEDIQIVSIVDSIPEEKDDYVKYILCDDAIQYIDCLLGSVCKYDGEQTTTIDPETGGVDTEPKTYQIITEDMLSDENRQYTFDHFKKNLSGKFFVSWEISEHIKNMIKQNNITTVQVNYWY